MDCSVVYLVTRVAKGGTSIPEDLSEDSLYISRVSLLVSSLYDKSIYTHCSPLYIATWKTLSYWVRLHFAPTAGLV